VTMSTILRFGPQASVDGRSDGMTCSTLIML